MAFLVFEGIDGCGKSTLIGKLKAELESQGKDCYLTREPGGTPLAEEIRTMIIRKAEEIPHPRTEILLYVAARAQHVEQVIRPKVEQGTWVLSDRFTASSVAFQSGGRGLKIEDIHWLNNFAIGGMKPELNVLLDLEPEVAAERRSQREAGGQEADRFELEKMEFHRSVRESYLQQAKENPQDWLVLNANKTPEALFEDLMTSLKEHKWLN